MKIDRSHLVTAVFHEATPLLAPLEKINASITTVLKPIIAELQEVLLQWEGNKCASIEENRRLAAFLQVTLDRLGVKLVCPLEGCGQPARIECGRSGRAKHGTFRFTHRVGERYRSHISSSTLPRLILCKI